MKIYQIVLLFFLLINKVFCEPASARSEFFLAYDYIVSLFEHDKIDGNKILESFDDIDKLKGLQTGSKEFMESIFNFIQNNDIDFNSVYSSGKSMDDVINECLKLKNGKRFKFQNGLYKDNLYGGRFSGTKPYSQLIDRLAQDSFSLYETIGDKSMLNNLKYNLEAVRNARYNVMLDKYKNNKDGQPDQDGKKTNIYELNNIKPDEPNYRFLQNGEEIPSLNKINKDLNLGKYSSKIDDAHRNIVNACHSKSIQTNDLLEKNFSC